MACTLLAAGLRVGEAEITGADQLAGLPGAEDRQAVGAVKALISPQVGAAALGKPRTFGEQIPTEGGVAGKGPVEQV